MLEAFVDAVTWVTGDSALVRFLRGPGWRSAWGWLGALMALLTFLIVVGIVLGIFINN
jgi:hypothetical protein